MGTLEAQVDRTYFLLLGAPGTVSERGRVGEQLVVDGHRAELVLDDGEPLAGGCADFRDYSLDPKGIVKIMAPSAVFRSFEPLFYILFIHGVLQYRNAIPPPS